MSHNTITDSHRPSQPEEQSPRKQRTSYRRHRTAHVLSGAAATAAGILGGPALVHLGENVVNPPSQPVEITFSASGSATEAAKAIEAVEGIKHPTEAQTNGLAQDISNYMIENDGVLTTVDANSPNGQAALVDAETTYKYELPVGDYPSGQYTYHDMQNGDIVYLQFPQQPQQPK